MLVTDQLHDHLRGDATVGQFGDEAAPAAVRRCPIDACPLVKQREELTERVRRESSAFLASELLAG